MKIASSNIQFFTEYTQRDRERNNAFISARTQPPSSGSENTNGTIRNLETEERVSLNSSNSINTYSTSSVRTNGEEAAQQHTTQKAVSSILSRFYSQKVRLTDIALSPTTKSNLASQQQTTLDINQSSASINNTNSSIDNNPSSPSQFSISAGSYYEYQSNQSLSFIARGEIKTEDGRSINFEFFAQAQQDFEYRRGSGAYVSQVAQRTDPLIVNLEGDYNNLSTNTFKFDLDNDGSKEDLSFAGQGSGFLVLDKNQDGKINNGSEMFGPETGNGFSELAKYDDDGNGFIDSGDAIFNDLKVWVKDADGNDQLLSLQDADVAAIGVESGFSPFEIKDSYNNEFGQVQSTGIFVRESGEVGSVQQINLTHRDSESESALKKEFDDAENTMQLAEGPSRSNRAPIPIHSIDIESLEFAMERLNRETENMLERQEQLAEIDNQGDGPKSLIQQIVEKLEEARLEDEEKEKSEKEPGM